MEGLRPSNRKKSRAILKIKLPNYSAQKTLTINGAKIIAGAIVGSGVITCAKGAPRARAEDFLIGNVMHANRNAQHGCHADQIRADVTIAQRTMVCSPICHD